MEQVSGANPPSAWKRIAVASFFLGLGITFAIALLFGSIFWYSNRPKQWNAQAIRAHYNQSGSYVALEDWYQKELNKGGYNPQKASSAFHDVLGKMTLQVSYDLENSTRSDYTLEPPGTADLIPMQRLTSNNVLIDGNGLKWSVGEYMSHLWVTDPKAVLVPALQTVRVSFSMDYELTDENSDAVSVTDWNDDAQKKVARHLLSNVDAFVLMDNEHHYRIELPLRDSFR